MKAKLKCHGWENVDKKEKFSTKLQRNLLENLQHNNTQKMDPFQGEISLPFKVVWIVEIKMKMVDDQRWNLKRGVIHVHTQVNQ